MPRYYFHVRAADQALHLVEHCQAPSLREALAAANGAARALIHNRPRNAPNEIRGSLDIEDEAHRTVARVMLADVARRLR